MAAIPCRASALSLDHLVGELLDIGRHDDSKRSGSPEFDRQLEPDRLLHRQLAGLGALEDLVHVDRATPRQVGNARSVGEEATEVHEVAVTNIEGSRCRRASAAMRCCALKNKGPGNTKTASMRSPIMAENAESSSSWLRIAIICSCTPSATAAASDVLSISPLVRSPNVPGSHNPATRESVGTTSLNNCRRLAVSSGARNANPVTFPPGRARLDTSPSATASPRAKATMGIVVVACRAARAAAVLGAMITSTSRPTSSTANGAKRAGWPCASRNSIAMF